MPVNEARHFLSARGPSPHHMYELVCSRYPGKFWERFKEPFDQEGLVRHVFKTFEHPRVADYAMPRNVDPILVQTLIIAEPDRVAARIEADAVVVALGLVQPH